MRRLIATLGLVLLTACGSGGEQSSSGGGAGGGAAAVRLSAPEGARLLTQATFGATPGAVDAITNTTASAWVNQQIQTPVSMSHLTALDARLAQLRLTNPNATLNVNHFYESWWRHVATGDDQLRARMAFALSQIMVVSIPGGELDVRGAGSYYDMLLANAFGNFRTLLEDVTLHPVMGRYLTYLGNEKEDASGRRTPDENYAREVMQLFTIGLYELNQDGTRKLDAQGQPIPTYTSADIAGLAKVFTGLSFYHPNPTDGTFFGGNADPNQWTRPMIAYPRAHSTSAKTFLGTTIPASTTPDTMGDVKIALDRLFNHPNVGPFIAQRLIQQFVTSNPSPAYVGRVAAEFNNNGSGVRGDLAAVIRAVLLDEEARSGTTASAASFGKLREPVIRMSNWMRAFGATSTSGTWQINSTSSNQSLGQSPLSSPSVFNFWRPGFKPPGANALGGDSRLVAPEFQLVDEVSVAGYLNTLQGAVDSGFGSNRDVTTSYSDLLTLSETAPQLVDRVLLLLGVAQAPAATRQRIIDAVSAIAIPAAGSAQTQIDAARHNRIKTAIFFTMASPEYLIQR